jgi:hypothetical protein
MNGIQLTQQRVDVNGLRQTIQVTPKALTKSQWKLEHTNTTHIYSTTRKHTNKCSKEVITRRLFNNNVTWKQIKIMHQQTKSRNDKNTQNIIILISTNNKDGTLKI